MPTTLAAVCVLAVVAVSATQDANSARLRNHAASRSGQQLRAENATAKTPTILYNATAKLPVAAVHMSGPPRWQTKQQEKDAKLARPAKVPGKVVGAMAGALGAAAQQALKNREAEEAKRKALADRKRMEAVMRQKCEDAAPGSARARRCEKGTYPRVQSVAGATSASGSDATAAGTSGSSSTVPLGRSRALREDRQEAAPEPQSVTPADEKGFRTRAAEKFGSADDALKSADVDADGLVSREELEKFMTEKLGFTPEEAAKLADALMKKYDADADGKLTAQQFRDIVNGLGKKGGASGASVLATLALAFLAQASLA